MTDTAPAAGRIRVSTEDHVGTIVIDSPARRNALSFAMWTALGDALETMAADAGIRCVVLRGEGGKAFASGADISEFDTMRSSPAAVDAYNHACERAMDGLAAFPKPTIAMIEGFCVGGGAALAVACDIRIAARNARFSIPAAKLGVGYDYAGISRLIDVVGPARAKEIFFTARIFDADEALAMNLLNRLVEESKLGDAVAEYAGMIAANAPLTIASVKLSVANALMDPDKRDLAACLAAELACFQSADYQEGKKAFTEKRRPVFNGR